MYSTTISSLVWWMYLIKRSVFSDLRKMKRDVNGWTLQRSEMGVSLSFLPPASRLHLCSVSLLFSTHFFSLFLPPSSSHIFLSLFLSFINPMWILHSLYFYIFSPFKTSSCGMKLFFFSPCFLALFPQISQGRKSLFSLLVDCQELKKPELELFITWAILYLPHHPTFLFLKITS